MTENTENLRKFLESDDPAMRMMGLSMAKGSGLPEEVLPTILGFYFWNDDNTIRAAAKSAFMKQAPDELKEIVKKNWKANYRTNQIKSLNAIRPIVQVWKSQEFNDIVWERVEPIVKTTMKKGLQSGKNWDKKEEAVKTLGMIDDPRVVKPLIKALEDNVTIYRVWGAEQSGWNVHAAEALGKIGDKRALNPLIKLLRDVERPSTFSTPEIVQEAVRNALKKLGHNINDELSSVKVEKLISLIEMNKMVLNKYLKNAETDSYPYPNHCKADEVRDTINAMEKQLRETLE